MVALGIDRIAEYKSLFGGRRIGLITNYSGVDSRLTDDITAFHDAGYSVVKLFTPEHGLYGAADGAGVGDGAHPRWGTPIISLYVDKREPSVEDLQGLDLLVYDIQDVGLRYYTYIYTLANCMRAANEINLPMAVLDRPNPLGDTLTGNRMDPRYNSFVGDHRLLTRYGMTPAETALYFKHEMNLSLDVTPVTMTGYRRHMRWPQTEQLWNMPSPSIHTFDTALCYVGGCFFEATNISEGRGTGRPFQIYGAPFIDMTALVKRLRLEITDDNIAFRERAFTPFWSKYSCETCFGVEFMPLSDSVDFMRPALMLMKAIVDMYPRHVETRSYADVSRLASLSGDDGVDRYLRGELSLNALMDDWRGQAETFARETAQYHLYDC